MLKLIKIFLIIMIGILMCANASATWWNSDYNYYKPITINHTYVNGTILNHTLLINITDTDLRYKALSSGNDIVFINDAHNTQLDHQIENTFNSSTGHLIAWIRIPEITSTSDTIINMYYNNSGATNSENPSGVWGNNASGVWLMDEGTGTWINDSSSNTNNGSLENMASPPTSVSGWNTSGKIDGCLNYDGTNDQINCGNNNSLNINTSTIIMWVKLNQLPSVIADDFNIVYKRNVTTGYAIAVRSVDNSLHGWYKGLSDDYLSGTGTSLEINKWYHLSITYNGTYLISYINGNIDLKDDTSGTVASYSGDFKIGGSGAHYTHGSIDNICIYNRALSDIDIATNYNNTASPDSFSTVGVEQRYTPVNIEFVSFTPTNLYQNYTECINVSFGVSHDAQYALNLSSLAFLHGTNYTIDETYNNTIQVPPNSICEKLNQYGKLFRGINRNITPYLSWETNNTITEGNIYKWSGMDNNSKCIIKNKINDTFTYINISIRAPQIFPNMHYLDAEKMYDAPKTQFEISRAHSLIMKMWDVDLINSRDMNYIVSMYFDTDYISTHPPNQDILIYWGNNSFNPLTDDFLTSPYCGHLETWNYSRWREYIFSPDKNASYCAPLVLNASLYTDPLLDATNYIIFVSDTVSSKPYLLNVTNSNPGICNRTFAQTNTLWDYNELSGTASAYDYTPSCFYTFNRKFERLEYHLYIANNNSSYAHSDIFYKDIGTANYPPTIPEIHHFKIYCPYHDFWINETLMDATYDEGYMYINIQKGYDPDGGTVKHNLSLHYSNKTYIATINSSFPSGNIVEINFTSSDYYSSVDSFTFRVNITDNEGLTNEKWLGKNFTLGVDGSQGAVFNGKISFWGYQDLPSLYSAISNSSLLSYNAGNDIYTMHYPFFKSKVNDVFVINHTLHLKSINTDNVSYFRFRGMMNVDGTSIHAWNTNTNTVAPLSDIYRAYFISPFAAHTYINDSELSNLGIDEFRQEGINFVNPVLVRINNSILSYNSRGIIFEYADSPIINNSIISNNVEVGIGIYNTNNSSIFNNQIVNNGRTGIRLYDAYHNIINGNVIDNSGYHGTWCQLSENNTYNENDIKNSATGYYDYYFASFSIDNRIIDPLSIINKIRCTSTASVNITNTDNQIFSHDSQNFNSIANSSNFSLTMSGITETININQHNLWVTPINGSLTISDIRFGTQVFLKTESPTNISSVWFVVQNPKWIAMNVKIDRDGIYYDNRTGNNTGYIIYTYDGGYSSHIFRFYEYDNHTLALQLYLMIIFVALVFMGITFIFNIEPFMKIISSLISGTIFILSGITMFTTDINTYHGANIYLVNIDWIGTLLVLIGVVMCLYTILIIYQVFASEKIDTGYQGHG